MFKLKRFEKLLPSTSKVLTCAKMCSSYDHQDKAHLDQG